MLATETTHPENHKDSSDCVGCVPKPALPANGDNKDICCHVLAPLTAGSQYASTLVSAVAILRWYKLSNARKLTSTTDNQSS